MNEEKMAERTPFEISMDRLIDESEKMKEALKIFRERVSPCLRPPEEDTDVEKEKGPVESPLEQSLRHVTNTLRDSQEILTDINERLCF